MIAGSYGRVYLVLKEAAKLSSKLAVAFCIPTSNRVPIALHPHQHLVFLAFQILGILIVCSGISLLFHFAISLMIYDVEHLFICLFAICIFSFGEVSVKIFSTFFNWVVFLLLSCKSSLHILDNSPL